VAIRTSSGPEEERHPRTRRDAVVAFLWSLCGGVVVLFLFFFVLGGIDPTESTLLSVIIAALALAWLGHSWRTIWRPVGSPRDDRQRRGF
jgi:VIT1/CCC1 family predicted Fe2+/Mn2+ transporter